MIVGEMLGPYRVLAKLGEGGMGSAFAAWPRTNFGFGETPSLPHDGGWHGTR
jgi:hypothetical protein